VAAAVGARRRQQRLQHAQHQQQRQRQGRRRRRAGNVTPHFPTSKGTIRFLFIARANLSSCINSLLPPYIPPFPSSYVRTTAEIAGYYIELWGEGVN
jgi:hypothetical protein